MVDQPIDVMLVEEGRLPAVRFGIVAPLARIMPDLDRIIILPPAAVLEARAREAGPGVDDVAIVARTLAQRRRLLLRADRVGGMRHRPVGRSDEHTSELQ